MGSPDVYRFIAQNGPCHSSYSSARIFNCCRNYSPSWLPGRQPWWKRHNVYLGRQVVYSEGLHSDPHQLPPDGGEGEGGEGDDILILDRRFYHHDHLGSPVMVVDLTGNVVSTHKYEPFGVELPEIIGGAGESTHRFTGHERDQETGLDYMMARYYGISFGRFLSPDPSRLGVNRFNSQSWNRYSYVLNAPINKIDPNGLYEANFHQGWTYYLAKQAGFSEAEARTIARANVDMDSGRTRATKPFFGKDERRNYHGFGADQGAADTSARGAPDLTTFGKRLHHYQDTFSHDGFKPRVGHLWAGHEPDKTHNDPAKAVRAALGTFDILSQKAAEMGMNGFGVPDQGLLGALALANADILDFDPRTGSITVEVDNGGVLAVAKALKEQGYTVYIDGAEYN
jgi:RHS repeat-associated protein